MKRFIVRNYGLTRQFAYKAESICIANDNTIETDDEEKAIFFKEQKAVHVTDRGPELTLPSIEEPEESEESGEIAYSSMKVKDLQILAKDRQVKTSGLNKAELVQALEDYDAIPEESKEEVLEEATA